MGKRYEQTFHREETGLVYKCEKMFNQVALRITLVYKINKSYNTKYRQKCGTMENVQTLVLGVSIDTATLETHLAFLGIVEDVNISRNSYINT